MWNKISKFIYILVLTVFVIFIFLDKSKSTTFADDITTTIVDTPTSTDTQIITSNNDSTTIKTIDSTQTQDTPQTNQTDTNNPQTTTETQTTTDNTQNTANNITDQITSPQIDLNSNTTNSENTNTNEQTWPQNLRSDNNTDITNPALQEKVVLLDSTNTWSQWTWTNTGTIDQGSWISEISWLQDTWSIYIPINIIKPTKTISFTDNLINVDSIDSYNVSGWVSTYCSMISKLNLINILWNNYQLVNNWIGSGVQISEWDATNLISQWLSENKLLSISWFDDASGKIWNMYKTDWSNVFDFYIYTDKYENEYKWHRFVAFIAIDKNIYILDPIRTNWNTSPVLMSDYISNINTSESNIYMYYYGFWWHILENILTWDSWEKLQLNISNLIKLFASWVIVPSYSDVWWIQAVTFTDDVSFWDSGDNQITIASGTIITEKNWEILNIYNLWFVANETGISISWDWKDYIDFGINWQYLNFSKAVKMSLKSDLAESENVSILVKHAWDKDFGTVWITTNNLATCLSGISDTESNTTSVSGWRVEFYTCGASTFFVSTWTPATMPPGCNTFTNPGWWTGTGGLYGEYYAWYYNDVLTYFNTTAVWLTRIDPLISFLWDSSSSRWNIIPPAWWSTSNYDNYSVRRRWSLYIATGWTYTFWISNADDATYLWLDTPALTPTTSNVFINAWWLHSPTTYTKSTYLNTWYVNLAMFYGENGWDNTVWLERQWPGFARQYIPTKNLCSAVINSKPAWVYGCNLWLKANKWFTTSTSSPYAVWRDDSGFWSDSQNTISAATSPTYLANQRNFNPIIRFQWVSGTPKYLIWTKTAITTNNISSFIVQKTRNTAWQFWKLLYLYDNTDPTASSVNWANRLEAFMTYAWLWTDRIATIRANNLQWYVNNILNKTSILSTHFTTWNQNKFYSNWVNTINASYSTQNLTYNAYILWYGIGAFPAWDFTDSDIAEVITCDSDLSSSGNARNKIESYLAIKYWITLDQTTPQSYVLTTITWRNAWTALVYNKNIAWIAMDSDTDLYQPKSQSIDDTWDIIVESVNPISNKKTLIRWNDSWDKTTRTTTDAPTWYRRIARERQFQELNWDLWNTNIYIPANSLPAISWSSTIVMLVNNSSTFATNSTIVTWSLMSWNRVFTTNIANLQYITFANFFNSPPIVNNDTWFTQKNSTWLYIPVLANDYDPNTWDTLSITWLTSPATWWTVSILWSGVIFVPSTNRCWVTSFTYMAQDQLLAVSTWTATVNVYVNCPPVAVNDVFTWTEDWPTITWNMLSNDYDPDTWTVLSGVTIVWWVFLPWLTLNPNWSFSYTPSANFCGTISRSYYTTDWTLTSNTWTVTINVICVNDPPVASWDTYYLNYTTNYNSWLSIAASGVLANDYDIDSSWFTASLVSGTQYGTIVLNANWSFTYTPNSSLCYIWNDYFTYKDNDSSWWVSNTVTWTIVISGSYTICKWLNRNPVAKDDNYTGTEDTLLTVWWLWVLINDYLVSTTWINTTILPAIPSFNYPSKPISTQTIAWPWWYSIDAILLWWTPIHVWYDAPWHNANFVSWWTYAWSYRARTVTWTRTVTAFFTDDTNTNPQWSQTFTIWTTWTQIVVYNTYTSTIWANPRVFMTNDWWGNDFYVYDPLITKLSPNTWLLQDSLISTTTNGMLSLSSTWQVIYLPNTNFCGVDYFTYKAKDYLWSSLSNLATGTINITCVNDAPVSLPDSYTWYANSGLVIANSGVLANDYDVDDSWSNLQAILISGTANWTISLNLSWWFTYTPNPYFIGTDTFTYYTKDPSGSWSTWATVTIKIIGNSKLCIYAPDVYNTWVLTASSSVQNLTYQFDYFKVEDSKNNNSWYYTTLSVSNLSGSSGNVITNSNISIKAAPIQLLSWYANPNILLNSSLLNYQTANIPYNFIYRNAGNNNNVAGIYGSKLSISINVPAYTSVWTYTWYITYTLYEN